MPISSDLIERTADLKGELVDYIGEPRFQRDFRRAAEERFGRPPLFGRPPTVEEGEWLNFIDWFILQERLPDGRTPLETFVAERPELAEDERTLLLSWHDVVEGIFEVKKRDGAALVVVNVIDEMTYRLRSNAGPDIFRQMPRGSFIGARVVPIGDEWLLSGAQRVLPDYARDEIYLSASQMATEMPELVFRNPEKLAQAWEMQRQERQHFIEFFGEDLVILPGSDIDARIQAYFEFRMHEARDEEGKTAADHFREAHGMEPPGLLAELPDTFRRAETIGVINDEVEGMNFYLNFGHLAAVFADPTQANERRGRRIVLDYLKDAAISPLPFRRLAEQDPARASEVFARVLDQPSFSWERDGDALMRQYKAEFFARPALPSAIPLSEPPSRRTLAAEERPRPRPNFRPARRGKKRR